MVFYWIFNMEQQLVNHTDGSLTPVENGEKNIPFFGGFNHLYKVVQELVYRVFIGFLTLW